MKYKSSSHTQALSAFRGSSFSLATFIGVPALLLLAAAACTSTSITDPIEPLSDAGGFANDDASADDTDAGTATNVDAGKKKADAGTEAKDASTAAPDASTVEQPICAPSGFCTVPPGQNFGADGFLRAQETPDGTLWVASYGAYRHLPGDTSWLHFDLFWTDDIDPTTAYDEIYAMAAFSKSDVWVAGEQGYIAHFDGVSFVESPRLYNDITALGGVSSSDMWMFDSYGTRYRNTGAGWVSQGDSLLYAGGVVARATNDVWAYGLLKKQGAEVADSPGAFHWNGTTWTRMLIPTMQEGIGSLWLAPDGTGWAVATSGELGGSDVLHYDGTTWTKDTSVGTTYFTAVSGTTATDVWLAGYKGTLLHNDGKAWSPVNIEPSEDLLAIDAVSATNVFIGGNNHGFEKN